MSTALVTGANHLVTLVAEAADLLRSQALLPCWESVVLRRGVRSADSDLHRPPEQ